MNQQALPHSTFSFLLRFVSLGSVGLVLLITLFSAVLNQPALAQSERDVLVVAEPITFEQQVQRLDAVGSARALRSVTLFAAVADRVTEVNIVPGQSVDEGTVLLRLDARRQEVALQRAQIELADAERTAERLTRSREQDAIPQSELDDAITQRDLLEVAVTQAETELEDRIIRAPFDGVVGLTDIQVGDRIGVDTPVTTIDDRRQLYIDFRAPESALSLLAEDPLVKVSPWQLPGEPLAAQIVEIDSRFDPQNRTIRVRAMVDNDNERYRPGTSFRVQLQLNGNDYASVPEAALMWGPTSAYIWRVNDDRAQRVDVQIKQRLRGRVLVDANIAAGDRIITEGVQNVRDGQPIRIAEPSEAMEIETSNQSSGDAN